MVVRFGTVVLTRSTDRLVVRGDLTHATSASVGELTDGLVELGGDITLGGGNQSFVSTGTRARGSEGRVRPAPRQGGRGSAPMTPPSPTATTP